MNKTAQELRRFFVVGIGAVATDLFVYYFLISFFVFYDIAKAVSFLAGTVVAFTVNKYWTFEKKQKSYKEMAIFAILYTTTLGLNVMINKIVLDSTQLVFLSFLTATGASTILNFLGQKYWVFR